MSELTSLLKIVQPFGLTYANQGEVFKIVQRCEACKGDGGRYIDSRCPSYDPHIGEHYQGCKVCKGTGSLEANIVIGWKPYGEVKEQYKELEK